MEFEIEAFAFDGARRQVVLSHEPTDCPRCHRSIKAKHVFFSIIDKRNMVQGVLRCPNPRCHELFIATYSFFAGRKYHLISVSPKTAEKANLKETIKKISPNFVTIYNQALAAESAGLEQIFGTGLRKALEFLIKDFAIQQSPAEDKGDIERAFLGPCIEKYIDDPNIKKVAKRAAWLGNDEVHYLRKWEDKDMEDLKRLIHLTISWIDMVLVTEEYEREMSEGRK